MIERYTRKEMSRIWEPENRFSIWLKIELLACEAWSKLGKIPKSSLDNIRAKAKFDLKRIDEIEKEVKHDVISFLTSVSEYVGEDSRYIHYGLTSSDVIDTAFAVQLSEASELIIADINKLLNVLRKRAYEFKNTLMIGRTHGIHAEPITFGFKLAVFYDEMKRNLLRMEQAQEAIRYGKISGAVGTFGNIDPFIEEYVCKGCGLKPAPISTQIIQRDVHAHYFNTLAVIASSIEKFATEVRHLQRTEVMEAEEPFTKGQKGSSAMPHKRNPILSENISGLARLVRSYAIASMENISLWHERDISHSSVERIIAPDSTILVDFMLDRAIGLIEGLVVYPDNMLKNLELTKGLIFSEAILLKLAEKGLKREDAYKLVQRNAMEARGKGVNFKEKILKDSELMQYLNTGEIEELFDLNHHLKHIDTIFKRVFISKESKTQNVKRKN